MRYVVLVSCLYTSVAMAGEDDLCAQGTTDPELVELCKIRKFAAQARKVQEDAEAIMAGPTGGVLVAANSEEEEDLDPFETARKARLARGAAEKETAEEEQEEQQEQLTTQGMLLLAEAHVSSIIALNKRVRWFRARFKAGGDLVSLTVVDEKVIQLNGMINVAEVALNRMRQAYGDGDDAGVRDEFAKLKITHDKATECALAAQQVVGDELERIGHVKVQVMVDPDLLQLQLSPGCMDGLMWYGRCVNDGVKWDAPPLEPFDLDTDLFHAGVELGLVTTVRRAYQDTRGGGVNQPFGLVFGVPLSWWAGRGHRLRAVFEPGITFESETSRTEGDHWGLFGLAEMQWSPSGWFAAPTAGVHWYTFATDFETVQSRFVDRGVHLGIVVFNGPIQLVLRTSADLEESATGTEVSGGMAFMVRVMPGAP